MALYLCDLSPQNPQFQSNYEKHIRQISIKEHPTKCLTRTPQNSHGHQKQGKSKQLSQPKRT